MVPQERLIALGLVLAAVCLTVTGELFLKSGMNRVGPIALGSLLFSAQKIVRTPEVWAGFSFIGGGALFWLAAISRAPLSWAYPILSIGYLLVLFFSRLVLAEPVSPARWIGTLIIILGVFLVYRS